MKNKFKVGDKVRIMSPHFYPGLNGYKLEVKETDKELGKIWVKECIKTGWSHSVLIEHVEYYHIGTAIIRKTRNGGFRTTLVGKNGEIMFVSEVYTTKAKAKQTAKLMKDFEIKDLTK